MEKTKIETLTPDGVLDRIEKVSTHARHVKKRSADQKTDVARSLDAICQLLDERSESNEAVLQRIAELVHRETAYERSTHRRVAARRVILKLAIFFYEYRWTMLFLIITGAALYLTLRYWDLIVAMAVWIMDVVRQTL
jgi:hypothetical protein